jgi:hypothetical protein
MNRLLLAIAIMAGAFLLQSCEATSTLTSWKNPDNKAQVSKVVVMPLFEKLEYLKPFEQSIVATFISKGLKSSGSLEFLNPTVQYPIDVIKHRCDSLGADAILIFIYQGADKTESYIPPTTYYAGGYGGYGGYWGGGYWGGYGGTVATTGGYWTTDVVLNLTAKLYVKGSKDPVWTGEIKIPNPEYIDQVANSVAQNIYSDWKKDNLLKFNQPAK